MKISQLFLMLSLTVFSSTAYSEVCNDLQTCSELYTKLTGETLTISKDLEGATLADRTADLTAENAKEEFATFLNFSAISKHGSNISSMRNGEFLKSPVYLVSEGNMPQVFQKDGLVTLVYQSKKATKKLVSKKAKMLSKKTKAYRPAILEMNGNQIIAVQDKFVNAEKIISAIMKADK